MIVGHTHRGAFLARPSDTEPRAGVIVAMEMFGVTEHVRDVARRVAGLGYAAIAPDFYHRADPGIELPATAEGRARGLELLGTLRRSDVVADVRAAADRLRRDGAQRVGMLGLSLGGHLAYLAATQLDLAATVVFYGGWLTDGEIALGRPEPTVALTPGVAGRMLLLYGEHDHVAPAADRAALADALARAGVRHELVVYPDTPHGFFCDRRDTFRAAESDDAWERVRTLFAEELGAPRAAA